MAEGEVADGHQLSDSRTGKTKEVITVGGSSVRPWASIATNPGPCAMWAAGGDVIWVVHSHILHLARGGHRGKRVPSKIHLHLQFVLETAERCKQEEFGCCAVYHEERLMLSLYQVHS